MLRVGVVGISYRHASLDDVARFAIPKADVLSVLPRLREAIGADEIIYLGTCNRVEVVFALTQGTPGDQRPKVFEALTGQVPKNGEANATLRTWTGEAAIEHLFLVACGLDSAQAGEQEIAAQLKAAWQDARAAQVTGPVLDRIMAEALAMARHAHRLVQRDAPSLADQAVERVLKHVATQPGEVALLGVSPMTRRCAHRLRERGVPVVVVNRTLEPAVELAQSLSGRAISLADFRAKPVECAAVICAAGTAEPILDEAALRKLAEVSRSALIVDFGLPPNVDPETARSVGLTRIGMNELVQAVQGSRVEHLIRLAPVRSAIDERLARLRGELAARAIGPQLAEMRGTFERIVSDEVQRLLKEELYDLDPGRRERLQSWANTLAHRLAHLPLSGMRAAAEHASMEAMEAFFREARLRRVPQTDRENR